MAFDTDAFLDHLKQKNSGQDEFIQAVEEALLDIKACLDDNPIYQEHAIMERLTEPDRIIQFRVTWQDDSGKIHVNRGWRVQHTNAIGPYKGGLRFSPSVSLSVLKFLAFEQTFKNALTGLPMGAGKGGSDFDPKGKTDDEIMRFCQAFMTELHRHIGPHTDIPAGDIGVGAREIGYMFGQYKKLTNTFSGVLTGKGIEFGGAPMRPEATGFGLVHFLQCMLAQHDDDLDGKRIAISGAGNVAIHAAIKASEKGGQVISLSNSDGTLVCPDGLSQDQIEHIQHSEERLDALADQLGVEWQSGQTPWMLECDIALPCATQNELDEDAAKQLIDNGVMAIAEGANMPCTNAAIAAFHDAGIVFGPAKAANAGGVALSGLEMSQNAAFEMGDSEKLAERLEQIMHTIHNKCVEHAGERDADRPVNYARGANRAGFLKVADALVAFGVS